MRKFEFVSEEEVKKAAPETDFAFYLPERSTKFSAGYDFKSPIDVTIHAGDSVTFPTGIKVQMEDREVLMLFPRSSLGFKYGIHLMNTVGIVDKDYYGNPDNEGHIFIKLHNPFEDDIEIHQGDKICQGIFLPYLITDNEGEVTNTRVGGIGSTGK